MRIAVLFMALSIGSGVAVAQPPHARAHNPKGWGTKDDVRAFKAYFTDLKEAVRVAYMQGLCPNRAPNEVKLPKYANLFEYDEFLPMNVDRMCLYWRNGWQ